MLPSDDEGGDLESLALLLPSDQEDDDPQPASPGRQPPNHRQVLKKPASQKAPTEQSGGLPKKIAKAVNGTARSICKKPAASTAGLIVKSVKPRVGLGMKDFILTVPCACMPFVIPASTNPTGPTKDHFWEIFSPPRIADLVRNYKGSAGPLRANRSLDLTTGWDFLKEECQHALMKDISNMAPLFVFMSPPCTSVSQLQFTNWWRMKQTSRETNLIAGLKILDMCMWVAQAQMDAGHDFALEHPQGAQSWGRPNVRDLAITCRSTLRSISITTLLNTRAPTNIITDFGCAVVLPHNTCELTLLHSHRFNTVGIWLRCHSSTPTYPHAHYHSFRRSKVMHLVEHCFKVSFDQRPAKFR